MSPALAAATSCGSSSLTTCEGSGRRGVGSSLDELIGDFSNGKVSTAFGLTLPGMYYDTERSLCASILIALGGDWRSRPAPSGWPAGRPTPTDTARRTRC